MNLDTYRRILAGESLTAVLSPRALWRLTGPDAAICTAKGRMEGDVTIALHGGEFYLEADPVLRESLGARLEKYLIADDAILEDVSELWNLHHVFGATPPPVPEAGFVNACARFGLPGHDVWIANTHPGSKDETVEADVLETLRLEHAIPRWGAELTTATLPPEAGPHMLAAISYTKGCYVGQETIARLKSVGHVNRSLVFMQSDSAAFPAVGAKLSQEGREIGIVTSSGYSPRLEKGIALGYAQRQAAMRGVSLQADGLNLTVGDPLSNKTGP